MQSFPESDEQLIKQAIKIIVKIDFKSKFFIFSWFTPVPKSFKISLNQERGTNTLPVLKARPRTAHKAKQSPRLNVSVWTLTFPVFINLVDFSRRDYQQTLLMYYLSFVYSIYVFKIQFSKVIFLGLPLIKRKKNILLENRIF